MKKYIFTAALVLGAATVAMAQEESHILNLQLKNGNTIEYNVADIEQITFTKAAETPETPKVVSFALPEKFSESYVYQVMAGNVQVAEVCREYVKAVDKMLVVVYPMTADGVADLTKGISSKGASVVWDLSANTAKVEGEGETELAAFYCDTETGELTTVAPEGETAAATVKPYLLIDARGAEVISYPITKVATQYWTASNLRATRYADGSAITAISDADASATEWMNNTTGAYLAQTGVSADWTAMAGYFYNGYVITNEAGIAPEGWAVPTQAEFTKLRSAGNLKAKNFRSDLPGAWPVDTPCDNYTGMSIVATGSYTGKSGIQADTTDSYTWSSTKYYDALSKADNLDTFRVTSNATGNTVVSSSTLGGHVLTFGHTIRLIRK